LFNVSSGYILYGPFAEQYIMKEGSKQMSYIDWIITIVPVCMILFLGWYVRRYITGVSDYTVAGRVCHRYVLSAGDMAAGLGLVTLVAYVEVHYKTGFALTFWQTLAIPLGIMLGLTGYCTYRFRETRAMSMGQFLEMRYSRRLRIFSCFLRSIAEMMANVIMPALAARFFIYYLGLPEYIVLAGFTIPTFMVVVTITLSLALYLIYIGGQLSIVVTDAMQSIFFFPTIIVFIIFVLTKFSWSTEIVDAMSNRVAKESFLNPFDISELRDFNVFMLLVTFGGMLLHRASGYTGGQSAAKSAHEAKMASILSTWRGAFTTVFYVVIAIMIITIMNHKNYAGEAKVIRDKISTHIANELISDPSERSRFIDKIKAIPEQKRTRGVDAPFSQTDNPDEIYFQAAQESFGLDGKGSSKTQQFKTIFRQLMLPAAMKEILPTGLAGLFCMLILLFILSTDDSRIYSASSTLVQDCVVPFYKTGKLSPEKHIFYIRLMSIVVVIFFLLGSLFMAQLDYINLFINVMYGMWLGGCGPMIIFGLYSRFGTTAGAWCSLLAGMSINLSGILLQRNWAAHIYPWLERHELVEPVGRMLEAMSAPLSPYVVWKMNRLKFPVNSYEIYVIAMLTSLGLYCTVSYLTCKEPFNLERMLHRGKYAIEGEKKIKVEWSFRNVFTKIIGITPEYTTGDKIIAYSVFCYAIIYRFGITFLLVAIASIFYKFSIDFWGNYFLVTFLIVPGTVAFITAFWFGIGALIDLKKLFRDLANRKANPLDNGMVDGHVAVAEKLLMEKIESK